MTAFARPGSGRWWGLVGISLGVSMIIVDATIVNVIIPPLVSDLGLTSSDAQWVNEAYTLVFASLLLVWGRFADRYGRRTLFLVGVAAFALASVVAARAGSPSALIGARVLQGVAGAMILPTSLSLINAEFRGRERALAFAVWGSTIGGTAALGPLLGGWLATSYSWRWAFGVNLPVALLVIFATLLFVRESREEQVGRGADIVGAVLSVIGFGTLVFGLIEGRTYGWWALQRPFEVFAFLQAGPIEINWRSGLSPVPLTFVVAVLSLGSFWLVERARARAGKVVLLDLSLFALPSFRNGNLVALIVSLGEFGLLFSLPLWFQNVLGYSAFRTGLALLPLALGSFVASGLAAALSVRRGPTFVVRAGVIAEILGIAGLGMVISPDTRWWQTTPLLFVYGLGVGLATAQLTGVILADVPVARSGQGSGTQSTTRQIGSALGVAVLGTLLFTGLGVDLASRLDDIGVPPQARDAVVNAVRDSAGGAINGLRVQQDEVAATAAAESFSAAARWTAFGAASFLVVGLLATASLGSVGSLAEPKPTSGRPAESEPEPA
jgi:MFS family permease